jgi:hypothetical protein
MTAVLHSSTLMVSLKAFSRAHRTIIIQRAQGGHHHLCPPVLLTHHDSCHAMRQDVVQDKLQVATSTSELHTHATSSAMSHAHRRPASCMPHARMSQGSAQRVHRTLVSATQTHSQRCTSTSVHISHIRRADDRGQLRERSSLLDLFHQIAVVEREAMYTSSPPSITAHTYPIHASEHHQPTARAHARW